MAGEFDGDGFGYEGQGAAVLLAAGVDDRQHCLDEAAAFFALDPEAQLPPGAFGRNPKNENNFRNRKP